MDRTRLIAVILTALLALTGFIVLRCVYLTLPTQTREWPPRHDGSVVIEEEQFFEVIEDSPTPLPSTDSPSEAYNPTPEKHASVPAPQSGKDTHDAEKPTANRALTRDINAEKEEEAHRKANEAMTAAFGNKEGKDNSANRGESPGDSGSPKGTVTGINGTGTGTVGGGWLMPSYAKVPSTVTGSIRMTVKINREGKVTSVTFTGGDAPAATDMRLRQAIENEVRSRTFRRGNSAAPEEATAYITYRFR